MSEAWGTISKMENRPLDDPPSISLDPFTKSINLDASELRGSFFNKRGHPLFEVGSGETFCDQASHRRTVRMKPFNLLKRRPLELLLGGLVQGRDSCSTSLPLPF